VINTIQSIYFNVTKAEIQKKYIYLYYGATIQRHVWWMPTHDEIQRQMDVTKCIVMKLHMQQISLLAQIFLLTIKINLPSDVKNSAILDASHHLDFQKANI
jgi:hypothetical protein